MPRDRKRREHYPASDVKPPPGWSPPESPDTHFFCFATKCDLSADACCRRQHMTIIGTPEPRYPWCHHDCIQGQAVCAAMPQGYSPRKHWVTKGSMYGRRKAPTPGTAPLVTSEEAGPYAVFRDLQASVAPPVPTRDD